MPVHNIVREPIEPTVFSGVPQFESWAVSDNGASEATYLYEANCIWVQHGRNQRVNTCRRMIWQRRVGMFLDHKFAYSKDSECTELLDCFSPADAMHTRYPLEPIRIYATKQEIDDYHYGLGTICITKMVESQVMIEMVKNTWCTGIQTPILQRNFCAEQAHFRCNSANAC